MSETRTPLPKSPSPDDSGSSAADAEPHGRGSHHGGGFNPYQFDWGKLRRATAETGVSRSRIYELISEGEIISIREAGERGARLVDLNSLKLYLARRAYEQNPRLAEKLTNAK